MNQIYASFLPTQYEHIICFLIIEIRHLECGSYIVPTITYKPQPSLLTVHSVQRVLFKYPIIPYLDGLAIEESC